MKKKLLICFAMLVCILGLTACGPEMTENSFITKDAAKEKVETLCEDMGGMQQAAASEGKALAAYAEEYADDFPNHIKCTFYGADTTDFEIANDDDIRKFLGI